jgi:hypothetical protein
MGKFFGIELAVILIAAAHNATKQGGGCSAVMDIDETQIAIDDVVIHPVDSRVDCIG